MWMSDTTKTINELAHLMPIFDYYIRFVFCKKASLERSAKINCGAVCNTYM